MIRIDSIQLFEQPEGFTPMFRRPFVMEMTNNDLNHILNTVAASNSPPGTAISPAYISNSGVNLVRPQMSYEAQAVIPYGWASKRFSVVIRAVADYMGAQQVVQLEGFTDIAEMSMGGHIDPNTIITLSSYSVISQYRATGPNGQQYTNDVITETGYIANNQLYDGETNRPMALFKLRPTDALTTIESHALHESHRMSSPSASFIDTRTRLNNESDLFHTDVTNPAVYASRILTAARDEISAISIGQGNDILANRIASNLQEPVCTQNRFLLAISHMKQSLNVNTFTVGDLIRLDPNAQVNVMKVGQLSLVKLGDQSTGWDNLNSEKQIYVGTHLMNILPQHAARYMMATAHFLATNDTPDGSWTVSLADYTGQRGFTPSHRDAFLSRLRSEVLPVILPFYGARVRLDVWFSVSFEVRMTITVDGYGTETLRAPMWGSALYNPMVTVNGDNLNSMARQVETLVSNMNQLYSQPSNFSSQPTFSY